MRRYVCVGHVGLHSMVEGQDVVYQGGLDVDLRRLASVPQGLWPCSLGSGSSQQNVAGCIMCEEMMPLVEQSQRRHGSRSWTNC